MISLWPQVVLWGEVSWPVQSLRRGWPTSWDCGSLLRWYVNRLRRLRERWKLLTQAGRTERFDFKLESVCEKGTKSLVYCVNNLLVEMRKLTVVCQLLEARLLLFLVIAANIWGCEKQSRWWRYRGDAVISDAHVGLFLNFWTTNYNTDNLCRAII